MIYIYADTKMNNAAIVKTVAATQLGMLTTVQTPRASGFIHEIDPTLLTEDDHDFLKDACCDVGDMIAYRTLADALTDTNWVDYRQL